MPAGVAPGENPLPPLCLHLGRSGGEPTGVSNDKDILYRNEGHTLENAHPHQILKTALTSSSTLLMFEVPLNRPRELKSSVQRWDTGGGKAARASRWHPGRLRVFGG